MSGKAKCKCGSNNIIPDERRGINCCAHCGSIVGETTLSAEVQFDKSEVQGKFVNTKDSNTYLGATGSRSLSEKTAAQRARVHRIFQQIGTQLNMKPPDIEAGKTLYDLAHENHCTQGRHSRLIAGAALYIICRKEKTPHMLIDFADVLGVSLYSLAACYIKLVDKLNLSAEIPQIDPSLYIHRFCSKLEFGDKEKDVSLTALRLMQSFKRDWITQGRRPAGLCGAAIRIAASLHGLKRSTKQIINVVKVCEETVKQRINEFKKTQMASLTQEAFEAIDFEKVKEPAMNPPSFSSRKDLKIKELMSSEKVKLQLENAASEFDNELSKEKPKEEKNQEDEKENPEHMQLVPVDEKSKQIEEVKSPKEKQIDIYRNESLDDIKDTEVEPYILSEKEVELKTAIWESLNTDWISKNKTNKPSPEKTKKSIPKNPIRKRSHPETIPENEIVHPVQRLPTLSTASEKGIF